MTNPRGLVIDPRAKSRYIFWSDWGKFPRIERANLDGRNRSAIITTKIYWPNGLAIDLIRERIYFTDAHLDYIESCDYYGRMRIQILANDLFLHHPHSLSFFENHLYWVDRGHRKLMKMNIFDSKNKTAMLDLSPNALTVKIVHGLLQPLEENPCLRSNCEHLCLLSRDSSTGYRCECQIGSIFYRLKFYCLKIFNLFIILFYFFEIQVYKRLSKRKPMQLRSNRIFARSKQKHDRRSTHFY